MSPTSGVSTADKHALMEVLLDAAKSAGIRSIILVEHDMELVSRYSKCIIAMQQGRLLADMATSAFFANDELVSAVAGSRRSPTRNEIMLSVTDLNVSIRVKESRILSGLNLEVRKGEFSALFGR